MKRIFFLSLICGCLFFSSAAAAETLWVTVPDAKLQAERSAYADTIAVLPLGTRLEQTGYESRWYRVRTGDGRSGWIYRGNVSTEEPAAAAPETDDGGGLDDLFGGMMDSSIEADAADSSRSIRGLSPEAEAYAQQADTPAQYRQALDDVLSVKVTDRELAAFKQEGKIGEYAE